MGARLCGFLQNSLVIAVVLVIAVEPTTKHDPALPSSDKPAGQGGGHIGLNQPPPQPSPRIDDWRAIHPRVNNPVHNFEGQEPGLLL